MSRGFDKPWSPGPESVPLGGGDLNAAGISKHPSVQRAQLPVTPGPMALGTPGGQSGSSLQSSETVLFYFLSCLFCGPLSWEPWQPETLTLMGACFSFLQVPKYLFTVVQFQSGDKVYILKCMLTQDRDLHNGPLSVSVTLQRGAVCVRVGVPGQGCPLCDSVWTQNDRAWLRSDGKPDIIGGHKKEAQTPLPTRSPIDTQNKGALMFAY